MSKNKVVTLTALLKAVQRHRQAGKVIAFTNGCFDIIHFGHVAYLEKAKKQDRILIVGLNSDASIRRIKGSTRPINPQRHRARVLAGLQSVDYVCVFSAETPINLIRAVCPDVLIKGADWKGKGIVGADVVTANGGRIEYIQFEKGCSTSNVIDKIRKTCRA
ncbi:MAG: D-glycero-beta-D-manno-heptose 1-phosphate adenylyltransferase [Candidatus Omnitrophica bacterium]|nr:D-glycero-beta-D-manno-heptose 1-phosphate adenylyltransferase [Candidatus Omnitrophota bacterium]